MNEVPLLKNVSPFGEITNGVDVTDWTIFLELLVLPIPGIPSTVTSFDLGCFGGRHTTFSPSSWLRYKLLLNPSFCLDLIGRRKSGILISALWYAFFGLWSIPLPSVPFLLAICLHSSTSRTALELSPGNKKKKERETTAHSHLTLPPGPCTIYHWLPRQSGRHWRNCTRWCKGTI